MSEVTVKRFKETQQYKEIELATVGEPSRKGWRARVDSSISINPMNAHNSGARKQKVSSRGADAASHPAFDSVNTDSSGSDSEIASS